MFGNLRELPDSLLTFFSGDDLPQKQHDAMMLLTVTDDLWPHAAMVSVGEVVAVDSTHMRLAMWPNTSTTHNLEQRGQATLVLVHDAKAYYIRLCVEPLAPNPNARHKLRRFTATIEGIREDVAKYADLTSGIRIDLKDPSSVLARWQETIEDTLEG
ncbi:hypothetical protein AAC03nite_17400 [Alicyclobacillus acidoterrestris]|uniref:pyridoxamine 5'-phosphate oxidase family protein n=1 Tax=Alicyclobacillus suci TaxID=2816080 RepID=UPI0011947017|nr:pyridoxamine 5'-phosphate oxidase family protein [Alicyclobacillus suci]GEO25955.1 hypothetical protein AAC03nite_17400 [Alicyclobacillus acidoterrestris]